MKKLLILLIFLYSNCNQINDTSARKEIDSDTLLKNGFDTSGKKSSKGWELYSWFDKKWKFVLVHGTNRNKTINEIVLSKGVIGGEEELEKEILKLHNREIIVWMDGARLINPQSNATNFQKPSERIIDKLIKVCKSKDIELLNIENKSN